MHEGSLTLDLEIRDGSGQEFSDPGQARFDDFLDRIEPLNPDQIRVGANSDWAGSGSYQVFKK